MLSTDEHGANLAPGHPKSKFQTRKSLFFRKIFFRAKKVTKTGKEGERFAKKPQVLN